MTARHVIESALATPNAVIGVALLTKQAYPVPAQPYHCARDAEWPDICVVHVDGANLTANNILSADLPELACRNLQVGEKISAMGVNRRWIGTPYRHPKGTPLSGGFWR